MRIELKCNGLLLTETTTNALIKEMQKENISNFEIRTRIINGFIETFIPSYIEMYMSEGALKPSESVFKTIKTIKEMSSTGPVESIIEIEYPITPDENGFFGTWEN